MAEETADDLAYWIGFDYLKREYVNWKGREDNWSDSRVPYF
ncbi:hypothetical protein [Salinibacillus aidingensis]